MKTNNKQITEEQQEILARMAEGFSEWWAPGPIGEGGRIIAAVEFVL
jgi:hypothetical protein